MKKFHTLSVSERIELYNHVLMGGKCSFFTGAGWQLHTTSQFNPKFSNEVYYRIERDPEETPFGELTPEQRSVYLEASIAGKEIYYKNTWNTWELKTYNAYSTTEFYLKKCYKIGDDKC